MTKPTDASGDEKRFIIDHNMIHDLVSGRHVTTEIETPENYRANINDALELLNQMQSQLASRDAEITKLREAVRSALGWFNLFGNSHLPKTAWPKYVEICEKALQHKHGDE